MPPKKEEKIATDSIVGFEPKETKLLAAAFIASTAPDKYNYDLMSDLTGNTVGSLKKMLPPVKRKATEAHASFAAFLGVAVDSANGDDKKAPPKEARKKRKATSEPDEGDTATKDSQAEADKADGKKKAPNRGRGRPKKVAKKEPTSGSSIEGASTEDEETKGVGGKAKN